jgi:hypothetical protein
MFKCFGTKKKSPIDQHTKTKKLKSHAEENFNTFTRPEFLTVLTAVADDSELISEYVTTDNICRFTSEHILMIAATSRKHCEQLSTLEVIKNHPKYEKIKQSLRRLEISFQQEEFHHSPPSDEQTSQPS